MSKGLVQHGCFALFQPTSMTATLHKSVSLHPGNSTWTPKQNDSSDGKMIFSYLFLSLFFNVNIYIYILI